VLAKVARDQPRETPSSCALLGNQLDDSALGIAVVFGQGRPLSRTARRPFWFNWVSTKRAFARDHQEDEMPDRKTKRKSAADTKTKVRAEELAAADSAAAAATIETAAGAADVTRGEEEATAAAAFSASSDAAARRGARDAAEGAAVLSMADQVATGGALAAALSSDEFRRGMELAGIAGQVRVAAELLGGIAQPTLAAFLGRTSLQLHVLAVEALSRATEGAIAAHGAEHLAGELAALGLTEMGEGRDEYVTSEALGAASAEMAAAAVRSAAAGAAELAASKAMGGMASALANDGADRAVRARRTKRGSPGKAAAAVTPPAPKPATRPASRRAPRNPSTPKT
jgi:hypothetical protein